MVRGNISSNASSHGVQFRTASVPFPGENVAKYAINNLFVKNPLSILMNGQAEVDPDSYVEIRDNVILEGRDIAKDARGTAIETSDVASGLISGNIIAHNTLSTGTIRALFLTDGGIGTHNTTIRDNIFFKWRGAIHFEGTDADITNITLQDNIIENESQRVLFHLYPSTAHPSVLTSSYNKFWSTLPEDEWVKIKNNPGTLYLSIEEWKDWVGDKTSTAEQVQFNNSNCTLATYHESIGGESSHEAFMTEARQQSKSYWRYEYTAEAVNNYIRQCFSIVGDP